ncbi:MAG: hypothetical protein E4H02_07965 [Lentisphaerales bacterium]|nr:MAG: hypothetical protein E4H02_07965 [Lentisphaerales bacterium]
MDKPEKFYEAHPAVIGCSTPAVSDGKLFVRLRSAVACYDLINLPLDPSTMPPRQADKPRNTVPGLKVDYYVGGQLASALDLRSAKPVKSGKHKITVYFTQMGGCASLSAAYEGPDLPKTAIPTEALSHDQK